MEENSNVKSSDPIDDSSFENNHDEKANVHEAVTEKFEAGETIEAETNEPDIQYDTESDENLESSYDENDYVEVVRNGIGMPAVIVIIVLTALASALGTAFAMPYLFGSSPQEVYSSKPKVQTVLPGEAVNTSQNGATKIVTVDGSSINPVAAVAQKLQPSVVNIRAQQVQNPLYHPTETCGIGFYKRPACGGSCCGYR
ncbi:MAG: hypothetical protein HY779_02010 [Rubrobacteridae bacterium]|nr:hypothetical protein [Rubrobacteridae bacterium]